MHSCSVRHSQTRCARLTSGGVLFRFVFAGVVFGLRIYLGKANAQHDYGRKRGEGKEVRAKWRRRRYSSRRVLEGGKLTFICWYSQHKR